MHLIHTPDRICASVLGKQHAEEQKLYRPLFQLHFELLEDQWVCVNILTAETIVLSASEKDAYFSGKVEARDPAVKTLIEKWFLVPCDFDDKQFAQNLEKSLYALNCIYTEQPIRQFTILPTTDCNARCFYCFEHSAKHCAMTAETAVATADYIERHYDHNAKNVVLRWFGGEPLYNSDAIDTICTELQKRGIPYNSRMVSNGYLFDGATIQKAIDLWHLTWVQITLDGTEEIYNRIKAYIYKDGSAFARVMRNIGLLLDAGIEVNIRLNMDDHNRVDLARLVDILAERFPDREKLTVQSHLLFEDSCARIESRADDDRRTLIEQQMALQDYIYQKFNRIRGNLTFWKRSVHCMADSNRAVMILPDGHLGKCQHHVDSHFYGNIWDDQIDFDEFNWYKKTVQPVPECADCEYYVVCRYPQCCSSRPQRCDPWDKKQLQNAFREQAIFQYNKFKKEHSL